ncbi:MAG TPA: chemotaxis protein CheA [Jatrophihabitans sp.]
MSEDDEIVQEFLVESHENLDQLDRDLVDLEQQPGSKELLSSIFRTIHTIKGTSGFLAFSNLESLTHVGENLLSRLRDGELTMTPEIASSLLRMVDTVRSLLAVVERTGSDADDSIDVAPVVDAIKACLETPAEEAKAVAKRAPAKRAPARKAPAAAPIAEELPVTDETPAELVELDEQPEPEVHIDAFEVEADAPAAHATAPVPAGAEEHGEGTARRSVADSTVRVDVDLLDTLVRLVGELVLSRNQILQQADAAVQSGADVELARASQRLNLVASELQESIMKTRMQPIGQLWAKFPRVVRDLGAQLGRNVKLEMDGQETELDRTLLEAVKDPLTHLVRNSIDHGIETPEDRVAAGKPEQGTLLLRAFHESGQVVVEIVDDGKGIDPAKIGAVGVKRGLITEDQLVRMEQREILNLIFRPGFSTAEKVTNVSGRGVGMDVVRTNIERIGGTVDLSSRPGDGTTVRVRIPLTLAIIPALVVGELGERYAIPQANLVELVRVEGADLKRDVEDLAGAPLLRLRGHLLPLVGLANALGLSDRSLASSESLTVVVLQADDIRFGMVVGEVHDTQEIVVKPLGRQFKGIGLYAGATVMGDGGVALILDVGGLAARAGVDNSMTRTAEVRTVEDDRTALLLLDLGEGRRAALPLAEVARLEEFESAKIERSGGTEVVQYRDGILPLVRLDRAIGLAPSSETPDPLSVVVHGSGDSLVGIVVDKVLDVVEETVIANNIGARAGVIGSTVVQDRVTDLVDLDAVVASAGGRY